MEKIQSAIAKARAERRAKVPVKPKAPFIQSPHAAEDAADQSWEALPLIEPSLRRMRAQRIVTLDRARDASHFDKLRTRMLQQMQANGWRRVAITSPGIHSGKTTISLNLAFSLSRQLRCRVVLSEMDLRRPSMRKVLRLRTERDFGEVVSGTAAFEDHAIRVRPNLALGMLQNPLSHPAERLQDATLGATLDEIEKRYDPTVMMFDMPPFQVSDDVMAFADKVDCVMIIAAAEYTKMSELDACERELANVTNVLGVVLNKCRYEAEDQTYEYYG
ncbi:MAG: CpsD/CapB family tyrosine-protein kinase [Pseudomonadota bacterium]